MVSIYFNHHIYLTVFNLSYSFIISFTDATILGIYIHLLSIYASNNMLQIKIETGHGYIKTNTSTKCKSLMSVCVCSEQALRLSLWKWIGV